jgi:hypothetical protein
MSEKTKFDSSLSAPKHWIAVAVILACGMVGGALILRSPDKPTRELQLGKSEIYAWRDQRVAYLDVMSHAKQMETAKSEAATLEELSHEIGLARAQASRLRARTASALDDEEAKRTKEERDHRHRHGRRGTS